MSTTIAGGNPCTRMQRIASGIGRQPVVEGNGRLTKMGSSSEVVNVDPSTAEGDIDISHCLSYYLSQGEMPILFTSARRFKNICVKRNTSLAGETSAMGTSYLVFSNVTEVDLQSIEKSLEDLRIHILYDSKGELLIVNLMPGKAHEIIDNLFADIVREKVHNRTGGQRVLYHGGAFRCQSAQGRQKEPDVALIPE